MATYCDPCNYTLHKKIQSDGRYYCRYYCLECGNPGVNSKMPKNYMDLPEMTESLLEQLKQKQARKREEKDPPQKRKSKKEWFKEYNEYLQSEKWEKKRKIILKRDKHKCQGCFEAKATHVHHFSYANVGDELCFQLISLCAECHQKCHEHKIMA